MAAPRRTHRGTIACSANRNVLVIGHNLIVGVHPNGTDAWAQQDTLAQRITAGSPQDEFNQLGQTWSQPPWRPDRLD
ncbi:4-alpha-glucanotransferase [Mycobacterium lepromatosis]|uniref:4-alpha-glucanotransferase n=1 Tax=Mycobacterium lepromatosis TaxID=480418 RepID=UPI001F018008|nr:4-alpha-glucanotransferase [Mycobacterium lepromatosis]